MSAFCAAGASRPCVVQGYAARKPGVWSCIAAASCMRPPSSSQSSAEPKKASTGHLADASISICSVRLLAEGFITGLLLGVVADGKFDRAVDWKADGAGLLVNPRVTG